MRNTMPPSRLPHCEGSIFARSNAAAARHGAVNLAQGFPDYAPDSRLVEALESAARSSQCHQYSPPAGLMALREAVSAMLADLYRMRVDPATEVTITVGATEAIFVAVQVLLRPGDEALYFSPGFECYETAIRLAGATPVGIPLRPDGYVPDWDALHDGITPRTRLVIINTPHNPTGTCWSMRDMRMLATLAEQHGFAVLSDEVYHGQVFAPESHVCAWSVPGLANRSAVVGSIGKLLQATGWRLGYVIAPEAVTNEFRKVSQFVSYCAATPLQHAAATVLALPETYRASTELVRAKRDRFLSGLTGSRFKWRASQGGYFQVLDYSSISDADDVAFSDRLMREHGIAGIPLSAFGHCAVSSRLLRFCVVKKDDTLDKATSILREI